MTANGGRSGGFKHHFSAAEKNGLNGRKKSPALGGARVLVPLVIYVEINLKWFRGVS